MFTSSLILWSQCRIIRTTELAAAQEKLNELERQKEETLKLCSPASFLNIVIMYIMFYQISVGTKVLMEKVVITRVKLFKLGIGR